MAKNAKKSELKAPPRRTVQVQLRMDKPDEEGIFSFIRRFKNSGRNFAEFFRRLMSIVMWAEEAYPGRGLDFLERGVQLLDAVEQNQVVIIPVKDVVKEPEPPPPAPTLPDIQQLIEQAFDEHMKSIQGVDIGGLNGKVNQIVALLESGAIVSKETPPAAEKPAGEVVRNEKVANAFLNFDD